MLLKSSTCYCYETSVKKDIFDLFCKQRQRLTSPFGHERVDVCEEGEEVEGLVEARLVTVQRDHEGALGRLVAEPPVTCTRYNQQSHGSTIKQHTINLSTARPKMAS